MLSKGVAGIIPAVFIGKVATTPDTCTEFPAGMQIAVPAFAVLCPAGESYPWSGQKELMSLEPGRGEKEEIQPYRRRRMMIRSGIRDDQDIS